MITEALSAASGFFKSLAIALGWAKQAADQTTGEKVAVGEINKAVIDETQAVNDARADVVNLERVRGESLRSGP